MEQFLNLIREYITPSVIFIMIVLTIIDWSSKKNFKSIIISLGILELSLVFLLGYMILIQKISQKVFLSY